MSIKKKECNVCFEEIDETNEKILPCNHVFCTTCLTVWNKGTCPTCRNRFRVTTKKPLSKNISMLCCNGWIVLC